MTFDSKTIQAIIAYAAIVMGVLTTQLQGVKLPVWGSIILGVFGVLLHPDTSLTVPVVSPAKPVLALTPQPLPTPVAVPSVPGNAGAPTTIPVVPAAPPPPA